MNTELRIGAAAVDVTPRLPVFLYGYPQVSRMSTGVHDPLFSSAIYLESGEDTLLFIGTDTIFISRQTAQRVRDRISAATSIDADAILISATHTHSGPATGRYLADLFDTVIPPPDPLYIEQLEDGIVRAGIQAYEARQLAEVGVTVVTVEGLGTHRHDPAGAHERRVSVLVARSLQTRKPLGVMLVCCMHPTVLHEDSTLISGDFPAMARRQLQRSALSESCPVIHHTGPCGNQSPRHVLQSNTFIEAERLGRLLADAIEGTLSHMKYERQMSLRAQSTKVDLPVRHFPSVVEAQKLVDSAGILLNECRYAQAPHAEVRTRECDLFGAEATLTLARADEQGLLRAAVADCLPAEIQVMQIGRWRWVGWPGEFFVEFGQEITRDPFTFVISMANGDLQGYITTQQAVVEHWYEAGSALFESPESGRLIVEATRGLLRKL